MRITKIIIEVIPHEKQRYGEVGDSWLEDKNGNENDEGPVMQIRVSDVGDGRFESPVMLHELVEFFDADERGVRMSEIYESDIRFHKEQDAGMHQGEESGRWSKAPYRVSHIFAEKLERLFAKHLRLSLKTYDKTWSFYDVDNSKKPK